MSNPTHDAEHEAVDERSPIAEHPATVPTEIADTTGGVTFWVAMTIGALTVAGGLRGLVTSDVDWIRSMGAWFVAGGVLVDLAVVPFIALVGLAGKRLLPTWAWRVVRAGLLVSALLVAFSWVLVAEPGGRSSNPTVRPRNYDRGLSVFLLAVWGLAGAGLVVSWLAHRRESALP